MKVLSIKLNSIENIYSLDFVGIEDICDIDLMDNVFQTFYADFDSGEDLQEEILDKDEVDLMLKDILISV